MHLKSVFFWIGVFTIATCGSLMAAEPDSGSVDTHGVSLSRSTAMTRMKEHIRVAILGKSVDAKKKLLIVASVANEIERNSAEILPEQLQANSKKSIDAAIEVPLDINFENPDYYKVAARLHLYKLSARVHYLDLHPPLEDAQISSIRASVIAATDAIRATMQRDLAPLNIDGLTKDAIDSECDKWAALLKQRVGQDPFRVELTAPLNGDDSNELCTEFEHRLHDSLSVISKQIADGRLRVGSNQHAVIGSMLQEILSSPTRSIFSHTIDPQRGQEIPRNTTPGFEAAEEEYAKAVQHLTTTIDPTTAAG